MSEGYDYRLFMGRIVIRELPPLVDANGMTFRSRHTVYDGYGKVERDEVFLGARMEWS